MYAIAPHLDLHFNDRLDYLGDGWVEIVRDRVAIGIAYTNWRPQVRALRKRGAPDDKSEKKYGPIPPGARWISMHPGGNESAKAVHVLIQPHPDGSASVIGGAGGKLNLLKLNKLRSPEEWKQAAQERAKKRREAEKKRQSELSDDERRAEKEAVEKVKEYKRTQAHENASKTLETLEKYGIEVGLSAEHKQALAMPPDPGASPEAVQKWEQLTREATQQVKAIHQAYERKLITDHNARAAARLGDQDLDVVNRVVENQPHTASSPTGEDLSRLIRVGDKWIVHDGEDTKQFDSWRDAAKEHLRNVLLKEQALGGDRTQGDTFYSPQNWVKEVKDEQLPEGFEFKPEAAAAIAQLSAERKAADKAGKEAEEAVKKKKGTELGQGIELPTVKEITQREVLDKLEAEAKTLKDAAINHAFLQTIEDQGEADKLRKHHLIGGYAALSEIASEVFKQNPLSRELIDALGHNEGAKVLAYMMRTTLSPDEYEAVTGAIAAHHAQTSTWFSKGATKQVGKMQERLKQLHEEMILLEQFAEGNLDASQQLQMDAMMYEAETLHNSIQSVLGTTLGKLQASAALVAALEAQPKTMRFAGDGAKAIAKHVPGMSGEEEPTDLFRSYGLTEDDFQIFDSPEGQAVQINESGLQKLAIGYNPEDQEAYERAVAIKRGDFDEEGFVPTGFSHYAKSTFTDALTEATQFDTTFEVLGRLAANEGAGSGTLSLFGDPEPSDPVSDQEIEDGLRAYIGARVANGDNPLEVLTDVRSPEFYLQQGLNPYGEAAGRLQETASNLVKKVAGGDISDASVRQAFQAMADEEAMRQRKARQTDDLQTLHAQTLDEEASIEAAHRTLAAMPMARTVFKPYAELSRKEKSWLRDYAVSEMMGWELEKPDPKQKQKEEAEPTELQIDIFGNTISAAEVAAQQRANEEPPKLTQWQQLSKLMGGDDKVIAAARDHLRGKFLSRFANAYSAISGKPPLIGGENISHVDRMLLAKLPEDQRNQMLEFMRSRQQSDIAKVRSRVGGKFTAEIDEDWMERYEMLKGNNRQISLLAAETGRTTPKTDYQRTTLGTAAEQQLQQLLSGRVIPNFEQISSPIQLIPEVNWGAGTQHATKQRALKFLEAQKKVGIHFGAGSGKSAIMLGCFSHLHAQGKIRKSIVAVPSSIVGQFVGEAATFLEAGKYKYNANLGMSREERIAAYRDPDLHIHVTTRESLANDLLYLVEKHKGIDSEKYRELPEAEQRSLLLDAAKAEGIDVENLLLSVDEAHDITARKGVDPSKRSLALNHLGYHAGYYVQATGDAIKNDLSEMYNFLHSVAPDKFNDMGKFMAEYGGNTDASRRALQRAIAPYSFAASTKPQAKPNAPGEQGRTLKMNEYQPKIKVSDAIAKERQRILDDVEILSKWQSDHREKLKKEKGENYIPSTEDFNAAWESPEVRAAVERLGAEDTWGGLTEAQKKVAIGGQIRALGGLKRLALWRLYHLQPYENNPKMQWVVDHHVKKFKEEGKPGIVFSSSSKAAEELVKAFESKGMRVAYIHGGLDGNGKDRERLKFQSDQPQADILIATDAARTGVNLTRGKVLTMFDIPNTEMSYAQRSARIHRLKQDVDTEIFTPMLDTPEEAIAWSRMERKGRTAAPLKARSENLDQTGLARKIRQARRLTGK